MSRFQLSSLTSLFVLAGGVLGVWMAATGQFPAVASHDPNIPTLGDDLGFDMDPFNAQEDGAGPGSCTDTMDNGGGTLTDGADPHCRVTNAPRTPRPIE